ncbi:DNA-binding response regulator, OmpR family, contains REC and winged-helix (wHTH) domain [Desulfuromusa kysingii]|uniref:DNA-binding response regulator, OmpR family, contains REC and winged-helix (WHTH) domain n=1 Tax=Desulfuromusa kysingii TaxID=37625 RepID=A0A1H4AT14_9BACT|nr:response regulator transcription factor [Desulfuromusa kysingii]SEA38996.1 DNA-binding response regulator, OmpR family, contains REC and winged-helix (wHTH) domain [Desulfuromusa kysingii]
MRILLVEDDNRTAQFIKKGFVQAGFAVDRAADGLEGLFMAQDVAYDAAVVDIMLPKLDGLSLIEQLRKQQVNTPIIVLSAKKTVDERILGLQKGGDDYLVKPFAFTELLVRVQTLLRRSQSIEEPATLTVDDLSIDLVTRKVRRAGQQIELQHREFSLLEYLLRNAGRVVSKTMIMEHVWDYNFDPESNVVESRICHLREKIDLPKSHKLIHTIRGAGYVLEKRGEHV